MQLWEFSGTLMATLKRYELVLLTHTVIALHFGRLHYFLLSNERTSWRNSSLHGAGWFVSLIN